ncbi:hypothetical protein M3T53_06690 [Actinomyces sp. B33]|uniref:hypothetical protein n=1 Tax=Actinomyces sp. B33 TaxID=2942131 RepID=UPI00233FECE8|nr:hypothetical protein [Actinomyces sp. B33]MDC4233397.1 hypothetical protein [Actinomyces sp. B33]
MTRSTTPAAAAVGASTPLPALVDVVSALDGFDAWSMPMKIAALHKVDEGLRHALHPESGA